MSDKKIRTMVTAAVLAALSCGSFPVLVLGFIVGGLAYGGITPTNSAFISSYYGRKHYPVNFSIINTNLIVASFGSTIAGSLYDASMSYMSTIAMIVVLGALGIAGMWMAVIGDVGVMVAAVLNAMRMMRH